MLYIPYIFIFFIGLSIGSFLNAVQYRLKKGLTLEGRSFCPKCKHQLSWYDLIPVFSWLFLRRKCRYCHAKISYQYPLIEIITGLTFALITSNYTNRDDILGIITLGIILTISSLFILIALHDLKTGYVYSKLTYIGSALAFIILVIDYLSQSNLPGFIFYLLSYLLSAITLAGVFLIISLISKEKYMGYGDAEIGLMIGLFVGWPNVLVAFFVATLAGAIVGGVMLAKKQAKLQSALPFGPFLVFGTFVAYLFGDTLVDTYAKIVLGL